jgi:hypothetical protein
MKSLRTRQIQNYELPPSSGPVAYGNRRASQFLKDLATGINSVDIVILGDSNTGSAVSDMWGYHHGFQQSLNDRGYTCYATPVLPAMTDGGADGSQQTLNTWRGSLQLYQGAGVNAPLLNGNTSGGSTAYSVWTPATTVVRYGSSSSSPPYKDSWSYISSAGSPYWFTAQGISIEATHPLATTGQTLFYRVRYGTFTDSTGKFCPMMFNGSSTEQWTRTHQSTQGSAYSYSVYQRSITTSGSTSYRANWAYITTGHPSGVQNVTGPVAIHNHSMYRNVKGWSVTSHAYLGGFSSDMIASVTTGWTNLSLYLQELRERQLAAGGTGRVLVMYHAGINATSPGSTPENPTKWVTAARDIWNAYKLAWASLGYPANDLACCFWCSHQFNSTDDSSLGSGGNMIAVRAAANQMALDNPDMTVVDIKQLLNYKQLLMGTGDIGAVGNPVANNGKPYFQRVNNWPNVGADFYVHLSGGWTNNVGPVFHPTDGYTLVCNNIINALMSA